jgi:hypothetical protein
MEIMMEFRFDFLSTVEFRPRLSTSGLPEKHFEQNGRRLDRCLFLWVCTRDRERRGEGAQPGRGLASPAGVCRFLFVGGLRNKP